MHGDSYTGDMMEDDPLRRLEQIGKSRRAPGSLHDRESHKIFKIGLGLAALFIVMILGSALVTRFRTQSALHERGIQTMAHVLDVTRERRCSQRGGCTTVCELSVQYRIKESPEAEPHDRLNDTQRISCNDYKWIQHVEEVRIIYVPDKPTVWRLVAE